MKCIVGLGNPGSKYEFTRHNIGFLFVDSCLRKFGANTAEKLEHKAFTQWAEIGPARTKTLFVKPQTFMNESGLSVGPIVHFYKFAPEDVLVVYDELDLHPFVMRLKKGGGTGGHNGLKSLEASLSPEERNYFRLRLGIGHPQRLPEEFQSRQTPRNVVDYVLGRYTQDDLQVWESKFRDGHWAVEHFVAGSVHLAMNQLNQKG